MHKNIKYLVILDKRQYIQHIHDIKGPIEIQSLLLIDICVLLNAWTTKLLNFSVNRESAKDTGEKLLQVKLCTNAKVYRFQCYYCTYTLLEE